MLTKLIILVALVLIAWYGFKFMGRVDHKRKQKLAQDQNAARDGVADTVQCPVCDAYIAESVMRDCGKQGCPY